MSRTGPAFVKGHGTENDFVLLPDRADRLRLRPDLVRSICDRRAGVGADGVIRVAPAGDGFFMDYLNADGSPAEMCGNGARVFARFLVDAGWVAPGRVEFGTRAGMRAAFVPPVGDVGVEMGPVTIGGASGADLAGTRWPGTAVDVGNPHLVCTVAGPVGDLDLRAAPEFDRVLFPTGVNVEFVRAADADTLDMRVYERGSGETRSCGTGTVAAAAVHRWAGAHDDSAEVTVRVPGGSVQVRLTGRGAHGFAASTLTGPAVVVATGHLDGDLFPAA